VGVLYHDYVRPGETFYRNTGAAHFTIVAQINHTGRDNTNVLGDAVLPVASFVVIPSAVVAKEVVKTGAAALEAVCDLVTGGKKEEYFSEMSSATWYAGYEHKLEIRGGGHQRFSIYDTKKGTTYDL
jgi:hypothetical protein